MKILVTGFDPFGGETVNPAWEAVSRLPAETGGAEIVKLQVPTMFGRAPEAVLREVERLRPDFVVSVGQAAGRTSITPERIAINCEEASIPDNAGFQPAGGPVVEGGPDGYFSLLPVKEMAAAIQAAEGIQHRRDLCLQPPDVPHPPRLPHPLSRDAERVYPCPLYPRAAGGPPRMVCAPAGGDRAGADGGAGSAGE